MLWVECPARKTIDLCSTNKALAAILVSLLGSCVSTGARLESALICSNAFCCSVPHIHWFPRQRSSLMLFALSARCSENLLNWFTMPRNVLTSCKFWGGGRSGIACSLSGSASIPRELMTCTRNLHLSRLSVRPVSTRGLSTASSLSSCFSWFFPWTKTSSMWHYTPFNAWRIWFI